MDPDEDEPLSPGLSSWISNLTLATSSLEVEDYVPSSARRRSTPHVVTPSAVSAMEPFVGFQSGFPLTIDSFARNFSILRYQ